MNFFSKEEENAVKKEEKKENPYLPQEGDKYEWIEGYKVTPENMTCYDYTYQLGLNKWEGIPIICKSGLHFCYKKEDLPRVINFNMDSRFFKCKGYVNISMRDRIMKENPFYDYNFPSLNIYAPAYRIQNDWIIKATCSELILEEELSDFEIYHSFFKEYVSYEEFKLIRHRDKDTYPSIDAFRIKLKIDKLTNRNYSHEFAKYIIEIDKDNKLYNYALALSYEDIPQDLRITLISKGIKWE